MDLLLHPFVVPHSSEFFLALGQLGLGLRAASSAGVVLVDFVLEFTLEGLQLAHILGYYFECVLHFQHVVGQSELLVVFFLLGLLFCLLLDELDDLGPVVAGDFLYEL